MKLRHCPLKLTCTWILLLSQIYMRCIMLSSKLWWWCSWWWCSYKSSHLARATVGGIEDRKLPTVVQELNGIRLGQVENGTLWVKWLELTWPSASAVPELENIARSCSIDARKQKSKEDKAKTGRTVYKRDQQSWGSDDRIAVVAVEEVALARPELHNSEGLWESSAPLSHPFWT